MITKTNALLNFPTSDRSMENTGSKKMKQNIYIKISDLPCVFNKNKACS